jgi:hypothetical protein
MEYADFDLKALYEALDAQRLARNLTWTAVMREVSRSSSISVEQQKASRAITTSTIRGIKDKAICEGDGILQMLLWLHQTPESFIPGFPNSDAERFWLPDIPIGQCLRWDARALYEALNTRRQMRHMTWRQVAQELDGCTAPTLTNLAKGGRVSFPTVMRLVLWVEQPAATFTRGVAHGQ